MNTPSSPFPGIVTALFLYALLCAGIGAIILYMWQYVRRILPRRKATPAQIEAWAREQDDQEYIAMYEEGIALLNQHVAKLLEGYSDRLDG
jgi:hypothetical protein